MSTEINILPARGNVVTTAPDLVTLARAIDRYRAATVGACVRVGAGDSESATLYDVHATRDAAFRAVQELWLAPWGAGSRAPLLVLHDMRALLGAGIVRPEWAIRVVAIATRAAGGTYCEGCGKSGVIVDGDGRHKCGWKAVAT